MNKIIDDYIEAAMKVIQAYLNEKDKEGKKINEKLPKEFKGYVSSLGAGILMSGLVPTIAFYAEESSGKVKRSKVLEWIFYILQDKAKYEKLAGAQAIFKHARDINEPEKKAKLEQDILDASVALKLCIRTFETEK